MSIAAGLSFTGCGNSGSTGSTFEQVPLLTKGFFTAFDNNAAPSPYLQITLNPEGNKCVLNISGNTANSEEYIGTWEATQSSNNTYRIEIKDLSPRLPYKCKMTCNGLNLTIPADKLKDYREYNPVDGATLSGSFTHEKSGEGSCEFGGNSTINIDKTVTIRQGFIPG